MLSCRRLERQVVRCALTLALPKTGRSRAAKMAIVAMTVSSSMSVKPRCRYVCCEFMFANDTVIRGVRIPIYFLSAVFRKHFLCLYSTGELRQKYCYPG